MAGAGDAVIGSLRVILSADTAAFADGLKSAQSRLGKFAASLRGPMLAAAAAVAGAAAGMAAGIKGALDQADDLGKAAQKFGVPVEALSALKHAADLSGVSLESLGAGLRKLSQEMVGNSDTFKQIGVNIRDATGALRPTEQVLEDVAEAFAGMKDGAEKTALAVKLFGKSGADLIPLLNAGKAGLAAMIKEARDLGLVITKETAAGAERFNDNLTRLGKVMNGVFIQLAAQAAKPLADLTDRLVDIAKNSNLAANVAGLFKSALDAVGPTVIKVSADLERLGRLFEFLSEAFAIWRSSNDATVVFNQLSEAASRLHADMKGIADETSRLLGDQRWAQLAGMAPPTPSASTSSTATTTPATAIAAATAPIAEPIDIVPEGFQAALDQIKTTSDGIAKVWTDVAGTLASGITSGLQGIISGTKSWKQTLGDIAQSFADLLIQMAAMVLKALILAAINQAISGGQPGAQLAGSFGSGVGSGLGSALGFAGGGSFKVGGAGGPDSQFVPLMLSPGEVVDIQTPQQAMRGNEDEGPGGVTYAPINNITVGAGVPLTQVKAMVDAMGRQIAKDMPGAVRTGRTRGKF